MTTPVSFELAKLLKEKGYDKPTVLHRDLDGKLPFNYDECFIKGNWNDNPYLFSAPTIAEVVMWLYEKYGIWVSVHSTRGYFVGNWTIHNTSKGGDTDVFNSPTEACEATIEYVLKNLI